MQETFKARPQEALSEVVEMAAFESMGGNLSGLMTPGKGTPEAGSPKMTPTVSPRMTPRAGEGQSSFTCSATLSTPCNGLRARRSSMIMSNKRLSVAVDNVEKEHSKQVDTMKQQLFNNPTICANESASSDVMEVVELEAARLRKHRRKSLLQAAEVVGIAAAHLPEEDSSSQQKLEDQINVLQRCVEGARRRLRQSIAQVEAVQELEQVHEHDDERDMAPMPSVRERLDELAAAWVEQEANRKKQALEAPNAKQPAGDKKHAGYLALLKTRVSMLGRRPERCTNRRGARKR